MHALMLRPLPLGLGRIFGARPVDMAYLAVHPVNVNLGALDLHVSHASR
jgi:hypothetical protein